MVTKCVGGNQVLQKDVTEIKSDVAELKTGQIELQNGQARLEKEMKLTRRALSVLADDSVKFAPQSRFWKTRKE